MSPVRASNLAETTTGTLFENTRLPMTKWCPAIYLLTDMVEVDETAW